VILLFVFAGFSYTKDKPVPIQLDKEFTIKYGQRIHLKDANFKIKFLAVKEDSRCPEDVLCIQAGNVKIKLKLQKPNIKKATFIELNIPSKPQEAAYRGYTIKLVKLSPNPKAGQRTEPAKYEATLLVSKIVIKTGDPQVTKVNP